MEYFESPYQLSDSQVAGALRLVRCKCYTTRDIAISIYMKKTSKYLAIILSIALTVGLSACGKQTPIGGKVVISNDKEITLKYTRIYDESDVLDEIINKYQTKHPNIHIVVNKVNLQPDETIFDYQKDLIKQIADGAGPDIFMINNNWLPYQKNQIYPMPSGLMTVDQYIDLFPKIVVNDFVDSDKVYAIPYSLDNLILYYNTKIFENNKVKKPPKTWQEVISLIPELTKIGSDGINPRCHLEQTPIAFLGPQKF
jgi:ABC-type glycerol-3-phosphate transport system substrate-binding protein